MIYLSFLHFFSNQMVFSFGFLLFPISLLSPYNLLTENSIKKFYNLAHCFPLFLSIATWFTQKIFNICVICISKRVFLIIGTVSIVPFSHLLYYIDNVFIFVFFGTVFISLQSPFVLHRQCFHINRHLYQCFPCSVI